MELRPFGTTGLTVSAVGLGAGHLGAPGQTDAEVERLVQRALDLGVTLFDTARGYGRSEERLRRAQVGGRLTARAVPTRSRPAGAPGA